MVNFMRNPYFVELEPKAICFTWLFQFSNRRNKTSKGGMCMTHNQINYWQYVEAARANRARENENFRHNTRTENQIDVQNQETRRHNLAGESNQARQIYETVRHNKAQEYETGRHNLADEANRSQNVALGYSNLREVSRHNLAQERAQNRNITEAIRHNQESERISNAANQIQKGNLGARYAELSEQTRHNQISEFYTGTGQILKGAESILEASTKMGGYLK